MAEDDNLLCILASGGKKRFPCDVSAPIAVSVAIGAGGLALLFVVYLMKAVSCSSALLVCRASERRKSAAKSQFLQMDIFSTRSCQQNLDRLWRL